MGFAPSVERAWQHRRRFVLLGSAVILGSFTVATALRVRTWADEIALWRQEVAHSFPGAAVPRSELGVALMHRGRYDEALTFLGQVSADKPSLIAINQATCLDKVGRRPEAMALLELLLATEPTRSRARVNLMLMHARDRRFGEARAMGERLLSELGDGGDLKALVAQVDDAAAEWSAMPAETVDEPNTVRARRAAWFERLGAVPEAQARWTAIARDAQASADLRLQAATFVALHGRAGEAHSLLGVLAAQGVMTDKLPALQAALEARFEEE
jgi:tetratricopeptide (TPR) repeat protein